MKKILLCLFLSISLLVGCNEVDNEFMTTEVVSVIDGDTIKVNIDGEVESVRFLLIDTPELNHAKYGEQPFAKEAKEFTQKLIENAEKVELEFDVGERKDKYGRLLAYIYADGKMVQEELLKNGLARVAYIYPPNTRYVDEFTAIEKEAKEKGIGIWQYENYAQKDGFYPEMIDLEKEEDCHIKGNIGKEKIYHTPDSPNYEQTKAEVMFCTEEEARKAGFRPPKQ